MRRTLLGAVGVVLIASSSGADPAVDRARLAKRPDEPKAEVRANRRGRALFVRGPGLVRVHVDGFDADSRHGLAPAPAPGLVPVADSATIGYAPRAVDRCLITVDGSAFDSQFVVKMPRVGSMSIVAPRVKGLPAGSWFDGP